MTMKLHSKRVTALAAVLLSSAMILSAAEPIYAVSSSE